MAAAQAAARSGARQSAQVNNTRADARTNNVRSSSVNNVNNVNVDRNVNVNVEGNTVAAAAAGTTTITRSRPRRQSAPPRRDVRRHRLDGAHRAAGCVPVNYGGMVYQQCGSTWYQPQGSQFVVVNPPY